MTMSPNKNENTPTQVKSIKDSPVLYREKRVQSNIGVGTSISDRDDITQELYSPNNAKPSNINSLITR